MPKLAFATDRQLKMAKPRASDYRVGCGGQLFLRVTPVGRKYWQVRYYKTNGKESVHQFAIYPQTSLAEAKQKVADLLPILLAGSQPPSAVAKQAEREALTFDQCATLYIQAKTPEWKNAKHAQQWTNTLAQHASPVFGHLPIASIGRADVLRCLEPIWLTRNETASRLRGRIESVLDWAKAKGMRVGENPAVWKGGLQNLLAAPGKTQKVVNHPSMPYSELPALMMALKNAEGQSAKALMLLILTATRTSEVLNTTWSEVKMSDATKEAIWTIPSDRMKAGREHRVPLSPNAYQIIQTQNNRGRYVFSNDVGAGKPMSNMAMAMLLRRLGHGQFTVHGFRSTFRNWAAEKTTYPREVCEHALAHQLPNKVEAAYLRSDLLEKRRALMQDWALYCESGAAGS